MDNILVLAVDNILQQLCNTREHLDTFTQYSVLGQQNVGHIEPSQTSTLAAINIVVQGVNAFV